LQVAVLHGLVADLSDHQLTLEEVLSMHLTEACMLDIATMSHPLSALTASLEAYMELRTLGSGEQLFNVEDASDGIYIVLSGRLVSILGFVSFPGCAPLSCLHQTCIQATPRSYSGLLIFSDDIFPAEQSFK
jgi:hypothetical protein